VKDSIYFKNKNEGKFNIVTKEYTDCNGEKFCVEVKEPLPYLQENEIHAPVFLDVSFANSTYHRATIFKDVYKLKSKTYLHSSTPLIVGDMFTVSGDRNNEYYISGKLRSKDKNNNFVYIIKRVDGYSIVQLNLNKLVKNKVIFIKGFFGSKK